MRKMFWAAAMAASAFTGGAAHAGVVIRGEASLSGGAPYPVSYFVESDRLREAGDSTEMIYRGDLDRFWTLDMRERRYDEMTRGAMQQMRAQMDAAMQQMRQQMQSMPEAQRKQIEAMMAKHEAPRPQEVRYDKAGQPRKVGAWNCAPYRVTTNGAPSEELCLARMSDLGLSRGDLKAFSSLSSFVLEIAGPSQGGLRTTTFNFDDMAKAVGFDAFPIEAIEYAHDGKVDSRTTIKAVEHKSIAPDMFDIPKGFTKREP